MLTVEELLGMVSEVIESPVVPADAHRSLDDIGLDSLALTLLALALTERYPMVEMPASDGLIDPSWTVAELHHVVMAEVARFE
ncbi:MAG: phosphopantetheine-binding protein [Acidimicrobiia bacterium]